MFDSLGVNAITAQIFASLGIKLRYLLSHKSKPHNGSDKEETIEHAIPRSIGIVVSITKSGDSDESEVERRDETEVSRRSIW